MAAEDRIADALAHHEAGRLDAAEAIYRDLLAGDPGHLDALHLLGLARLARGAAEEAISLIERAIALAPDVVPLKASYGDALRAAGRDADAASAYEKVAAGDPGNVAAVINLASIRLKEGRHRDAVAMAQHAVDISPETAAAHASLGAALAGSGRDAEALGHLDRALDLDPRYDAARSVRARALSALGRDRDAETDYRALIESDPNSAERRVNFAVALHARGLNDAAEPLFEAALARDPRLPEALNGLGLLRKAARRNDEAISLFRRALEVRPDYADALNNLGHLLVEQNQIKEGTALLDRAVEIEPENMTSWGNLIQAADTAEITENGKPQALRRRLNALLLARTPPRRDWSVLRDPDKRLRVGYVSTDFHANSAGLLALPIVTHHGRDRIDVVCYADSRLEDDVTRRFRARADTWRVIAGQSDAAVAETIVADRIDVLVDLSGYTSRRFAALATKPAPVQLSGWGFGHGMGLDAYDGLLLDDVVAPRELEHLFPDPIVRLPVWLCYEPPIYAPVPGELPARRRGYPVFGCFNRIAKIQSTGFRAFAQVLAANPAALLRFKDGTVGDPKVQAMVRERIAEFGGDAARVEFLGATPHAAHLAAIADLDVMLNPFPYGGGMSAVESLWMGVPLIAIVGERQQERGVASLLRLLDLERFIAQTAAGYVAAASAAISDLDALGRVRSELRGRMRLSVLCDPPRYARAVEDVYRALWRRWCETGSAK